MISPNWVNNLIIGHLSLAIPFTACIYCVNAKLGIPYQWDWNALIEQSNILLKQSAGPAVFSEPGYCTESVIHTVCGTWLSLVCVLNDVHMHQCS